MQRAKERMWDGTRGAPTSPADHEPEFEEGKSLERNKGLRKHESSVLIQMRTRKIGLRAFQQIGWPEPGL